MAANTSDTRSDTRRQTKTPTKAKSTKNAAADKPAKPYLDFPHCGRIEGPSCGRSRHVPLRPDMASVDRERISDERLKAVCEYVRTWLNTHRLVKGQSGKGK